MLIGNSVTGAGNNYYVTRCNALEDNCTIYRVVRGRRQAFLKQNVKVPSNVCHTLRVEAAGDHFVVTYDGKKVLDARDGTFSDPGKVGLWTKADSVIAFDEFSIAAREGYVDVIQQQQDTNHFGRTAHVATWAGARTSLFVPEQSRLYVAVPHRGGQKAEIRIYEAR